MFSIHRGARCFPVLSGVVLDRGVPEGNRPRFQPEGRLGRGFFWRQYFDASKYMKVYLRKGGAAVVSLEEFRRIGLRVGEIVAAEPVPGSNEPLKVTLDLGGGGRGGG